MAHEKKVKVASHDIGVRATNNIRSLIALSESGLFREISGRDYGIDAIVEKFEDGRITGKIALIQCKGQDAIIEPLKNNNKYVSCSGISDSNVKYVEQNNSLVILTFASARDRDVFYFDDMRKLITNEHMNKLENGQKTFTVRIPVVNNSRDNIERFFELIDDFYTKKDNSNL